MLEEDVRHSCVFEGARGLKPRAVVAELIETWLEEQRRQKLRAKVIEGCREMAEVYLQTEQEYPPLEEEVHRALEP